MRVTAGQLLQLAAENGRSQQRSQVGDRAAQRCLANRHFCDLDLQRGRGECMRPCMSHHVLVRDNLVFQYRHFLGCPAIEGVHQAGVQCAIANFDITQVCSDHRHLRIEVCRLAVLGEEQGMLESFCAAGLVGGHNVQRYLLGSWFSP